MSLQTVSYNTEIHNKSFEVLLHTRNHLIMHKTIRYYYCCDLSSVIKCYVSNMSSKCVYSVLTRGELPSVTFA